MAFFTTQKSLPSPAASKSRTPLRSPRLPESLSALLPDSISAYLPAVPSPLSASYSSLMVDPFEAESKAMKEDMEKARKQLDDMLLEET